MGRSAGPRTRPPVRSGRAGRAVASTGPVWLVGGIGVAALTAAVARACLLVVVVEGDSMLPTYGNGDRLLVLTRGRTPRRGDVVVARGPDPTWTPERSLDDAYVRLVKRVTAVGGEPRPDAVGLDDRGLVPMRSVYVEGDSPGYDSRAFGPLRDQDLVGRVLLRLGTAKQFDKARDRGASHGI